MIWFVLYSLLFIALAYIDFRKGQTPAGYFLNDRKSKTHQVGFSIIASCVGGSATVGMCGLAYAVGTPALWWLLSGAAGLVVLRLFMVPRIRSRGSALTMPEMIRESVGVHAHRLSCVIILFSWVAILAAQFLAMGRIVAGLTGLSSLSAMACGAFVIVLYTWLGGQASVIKSDVIQLVCLATGLVLLLVLLISIDPEPISEVRFEWLNDKFEISDWSRFMLLIGGSYIVCPMLFARIMSAESDKAARRGAELGILGIALIAFVIVGIGLEARAFLGEGIEGDSVLPQLVGQLPTWVSVLFFFVMASAILSSADSCLITAATVAANDILKTPSVKVSRRLILVISAAAFVLAGSGKSVLGLLLAANTIYTCAVVFPIFVTLAVGRKLNGAAALATIATAGSLALASELMSYEPLSYVAALVSVIGSLLSLYGGDGSETPQTVTVPVRVREH